MDLEGGRHVRPGRFLAAAALAWLAMVAYWYAFGPMVGIAPGKVAGYTGSFLIGRPGMAAEWVGRAVLFAVALGWGWIYRSVRGMLVGPEWARGVIYGLAVWTVTAVLVLPALDALRPLAANPGVERAGAFGFGFAGLPGAMLSLAGHALFGLTLGVYVGARAREAGAVDVEPVDPNDPGRPDQDG